MPNDTRPSKIITRQALENAIAAVCASGGSTNAVLHLIAIAREMNLPLDMADFDRISERTPFICDLSPGGKYVAKDYQDAGGSRVLAARLRERGQLHDSPTVSGLTLFEEADKAVETPGQPVIRTWSDPLKPTGGLVIMHGNLSPEGSVIKVAGHERIHHTGPARVFDSEDLCHAAVEAGQINPGDVLVIRYEGPRGGPGMREMLAVTAAIKGIPRAQRNRSPHHRRPFLRRHPRPHVRPRSPRGLPRRPHRSRPRGRHNHLRHPATASSPSTFPTQEIATRLAAWHAPEPRYKRGVMAKYANSVASASEGATTT